MTLTLGDIERLHAVKERLLAHYDKFYRVNLLAAMNNCYHDTAYSYDRELCQKVLGTDIGEYWTVLEALRVAIAKAENERSTA